MAGHDEDHEAIRRLSRDWHAGWLAGDADALVGLYSGDPVLMPQNLPAVIGKDAIRSVYQSVFERFTIDGEGELVEVEVVGDWGYFCSTYRLTATPRVGGDPIHDEGMSVFIVRRQPEGAWKITRLIANSDLPARDSRP